MWLGASWRQKIDSKILLLITLMKLINVAAI
jgi:hypothetical protein